VDTDFWRSNREDDCWVCGDVTDWVYLDLGHQHPTCDMWPNGDGTRTISIADRTTVEPEPWKEA
jgi:hypothetical protein